MNRERLPSSFGKCLTSFSYWPSFLTSAEDPPVVMGTTPVKKKKPFSLAQGSRSVMAAALWTETFQNVPCSLQWLLICGTKKEKKRKVKSEDTYDQTVKQITQCESDEGLESSVSRTGKASSQSYCEGKPTVWVRMIFLVNRYGGLRVGHILILSQTSHAHVIFQMLYSRLFHTIRFSLKPQLV